MSIEGTRFLLNDKPFPFTGVSFFNAIYNRALHETPAARRQWLDKFERYGINVLRVWAQWDNNRGFVDGCSTCTLYRPDGTLRKEHVEKLKLLLTDCDATGIVVELALFSHQSWEENVRVGPKESVAAVTALARELKPWRNLILQIWNEHSDGNVPELIKAIRQEDPKRIITNSPGFAGVLGTFQENHLLDFLSPHTSRDGKHWDIAAAELAYLLARFRKPVVDDEPARTGLRKWGGPAGTTIPVEHILHIANVWKAGAYAIYHHDMFQSGAGSPEVPPSGIPDPEFSPYHKLVFDFLAERSRFMPAELQ